MNKRLKTPGSEPALPLCLGEPNGSCANEELYMAESRATAQKFEFGGRCDVNRSRTQRAGRRRLGELWRTRSVLVLPLTLECTVFNAGQVPQT